MADHLDDNELWALRRLAPHADRLIDDAVPVDVPRALRRGRRRSATRAATVGVAAVLALAAVTFIPASLTAPPVAGRPSRVPRAAAMTVAWLGSGSLFAWSAWKLPLSFAIDTGAPISVPVGPETLVEV